MYEGGITTNLRPQEFYRAGTAYPGFEIPRSATINYYPHPSDPKNSTAPSSASPGFEIPGSATINYYPHRSHILNYENTGQSVIVSILYETNAIIQKKETQLVRSKA